MTQSMTQSMTGDSPVLAAEGLHTYYGGAHILADLSFTLADGEVVVLLGRNGAGKTTTMKTVMGLVRPRSGSVTLAGADVTGKEPHVIAQAGMGYVPEDRRIFAELTVMENLEVGRQGERAGAPTWTPERLFEIFPNLAEMRSRPGGRMSGGEQQMLTLARTLMGNPKVLLLDEPSEGLAPVIVDQMVSTIQALKNEGLSILLSEQNLHFATRVSDRAYIIEKGRIRYQGTMDALAADEEVRNTYLTV